MSEQNGQAPRVRFGDAPGNEIPADWAELLLRRLFALHPQTVGQQLAEVAAEQLAGVKVRAVKPR